MDWHQNETNCSEVICSITEALNLGDEAKNFDLDDKSWSFYGIMIVKYVNVKYFVVKLNFKWPNLASNKRQYLSYTCFVHTLIAAYIRIQKWQMCANFCVSRKKTSNVYQHSNSI